MRLDSVAGGTSFEFSAPPLCNINNTAGTALCAATQSLSLTSPTGVVNVARLNMTVLPGSTGNGTISVAVNSLFSATAQGGGIQPCNAAASLTLVTTCGDLNGDNAITIADALLVAQLEVQLRQCNDPAVPHFDACDVNPVGGAGDGLCNIGDALKIAQCNVGLIPCTFQCTPLLCVPPGP